MENSGTTAPKAFDLTGVEFKRKFGDSNETFRYASTKEGVLSVKENKVIIRTAKAGEVALTGIYLGSMENKETNKTDYKFREQDGAIVILNGAGNLSYQMMKQNPQIGELVQIFYTGLAPIKSGPRKGKLANGFEVVPAGAADSDESAS